MTKTDFSKIDKQVLTVAEANSKDVGRRIARVDPIAQELMELTSGDAIEVSSNGKKTTLLNWQGYPEDNGSGLIRIDGFIRNQLNVGVDDKVEIKKVAVNDAQSVTVKDQNKYGKPSYLMKKGTPSYCEIN